MTEQPRRIGSVDDGEPLDPDLQPPAGEERVTVLDSLIGQLEAALDADVTFEPTTLRVEKRPGVSVRYRTDIDDEKLTAWRKRAADRKAPDGFNALRFCTIVLANQCESILMNGQDVHDEVGQLLTFGHKRIRVKMGEDRAADAARKLIGSDPHVMLHANAVMEASGFGDQAVEVVGDEDPT